MSFRTRIYFRVSLLIFVLSGILFCVSLFSTEFAEKCSLTVCAFTRSITAFATSFLPFSLAEVLVVVGIPFVLVYSLFIIILSFMRKGRHVKTHLAILSGTAMLFLSLYFLNIGISYHRFPLEKSLELERKSITEEQIYEGALEIAVELSDSSKRVEYDEGGASVMPYSFSTLSDKLDSAYEMLAHEYDFIVNVSAPSKRIALSEYMTYTHISGVYMPITGEANVNTNYPDYVVAFSTAHEKAHQRGIAGEDEANFIAYLACMNSDDDYIRYSALMSMFDYYLTATLKADDRIYHELIINAPATVRGEMTSYYDFFRKYSASQASKVADKVNDTHLKLQGQQEGTVSYGLVVELCEAYRIKNEKTP